MTNLHKRLHLVRRLMALLLVSTMTISAMPQVTFARDSFVSNNALADLFYDVNHEEMPSEPPSPEEFEYSSFMSGIQSFNIQSQRRLMYS